MVTEHLPRMLLTQDPNSRLKKKEKKLFKLIHSLTSKKIKTSMKSHIHHISKN